MTSKTIKYYHKNSDAVAFDRFEDLDGCWSEYTYDDKGKVLTYKDSDGFSSETTYDDKGNQLTFKNSYGYWSEYTYDDKGNTLTFKNSAGYWVESTYDDKGNELTYKDSDGYFEIKGKEVTKQDFENRPCVGKIVTIDGVEYKLK